LFFAILCALPFNTYADDGFDAPWGAQKDSPFDPPDDDWSKRFDDKTHKDDRVKTEKPKRNNDLDNRWQKQNQKRQSIGDIQRKQLQAR